MILNTILLTLLSGTGAPTAHQELHEYEVGDRHIAGDVLQPFDAKWTSSRLGPDLFISEVARIERVDGRKCYVRDQVWPMGMHGVKIRKRLVLDASTLATISKEQEVTNLPEGASLGGAPEYSRWELDGAGYELTTRTNGEETRTSGSLERPMFEGDALGLVLAALPLKKGYEASLPVAMHLGLAADWTVYQVVIRVVGQESFPNGKRKPVEAWIVAVDWIDPETGEITSAGGVDGAGGAYFVATKPPRGFPHVPRYANDSMLLDRIPEE